MTFAAGASTATITLNVVGDTAVEANETFTVGLSNATGATITDNSGAGTITNDDAVPTLAIGTRRSLRAMAERRARRR